MASSLSTAEPTYQYTLSIAFPSEKDAETVFKVLTVDEEVRPDRIKRGIQREKEKLKIEFSASELRYLRVAVSTFLQSMALVVDTIHQFGCQ
eukprot:CAMPEP_0185263304 /NCGR_PEP_ID=MMETSP1359-20130426/13757_1 /TAXON_ID=552665 /ORGANISM="Bigelowiella longifila, Strain CCMP242" /LENGTH=91 /DNA_ID=CAMNT_0027850717 /DNA_START=111 /DNA_END=386 /DNA_ORIENTATION=-